MGVLVGLIAIVLTIISVVLFIKLRRWEKTINRLEIKSDQLEKDFGEKTLFLEKIILKIEEEVDYIKKLKEYAEVDTKEIELIAMKLKNLTKNRELDTPVGILVESNNNLEYLEKLGFPLDAEDYFSYGIKCFSQNKHQSAIRAFEKALELKHDFAEAWSKKGDILVELGMYDEAIQAYNQTIKINPDDTKAWYKQGTMLTELARYDEAIKAYDQALKIKPDFDLIWFKKSCIYALLKDKENAIKNLTQAIKLHILFKKIAKSDEAFKSLRDHPDFKKLVE